MQPPFSISTVILDEISQIERLIGRIEGFTKSKPQPQLRKSNQVRTIHGSLAIEGNTLGIEQVTAVIEGKRIIGKTTEIREVLNAVEAYTQLQNFNPHSSKDLLKAHATMMADLISTAGKWRQNNVGIIHGTELAHLAPGASMVPHLMNDLIGFLKKSKIHPLISGCVFHYELEFIHPFEDGNGRMGRFWHSLLLYHYHPIFEFIPVESLIKEHQKNYYRALATSDKAGNATTFIEFSLSMIREALQEFGQDLRPEPQSAETRLALAREKFQTEDFVRKDYLALFKTISTATASRDLKSGVESNTLSKRGEKALTVYRFN